jgi:imidazolonepropionase-like amidohydrolase
MMISVVFAAVAQFAFVDCDIRPVTAAPLEGGTVLVKGDRIVAVGRDLEVPDDFEVVGCDGRILTPGLIESDSQLGLVEISLEPYSNDAMPMSPEPVRASLDARDAIDLRSTLVGVARHHGITSAVTAPIGGVVEGQAAWLDLVGPQSMHAQDAVAGPVALAANLGQFGGVAAGMSRLAAHAVLREYLDDAEAYRRNRSAFMRRNLYPLSVSRLDLEAAQPVLREQIPLLVEVHRAADIRAALSVAEEHDIDIAILGASEGWLVADELARAGVPVIVDPVSNLPFQLEGRNNRGDNAVRMARAGVRVALSTRRTHNLGNLRFYLGNAVRAGMPDDVALRAGTRVPAEIFGRDDLGSIEAGKTANLVLWSGDPFEPASAAEVVVIRGERQPLESRQTKLADRYIERLGLDD